MENKNDPTKTNATQSNTDTILTHILQLEDQKLSEITQVLEHQLISTDQTNKLLENSVEGIGVAISEIKKNTESISTLLLQAGGGNKITEILANITEKLNEPTNLIVKLDII